MILLKKEEQLFIKKGKQVFDLLFNYICTSVYNMILRRQHHHYIIGGGGAFWKYINRKFANLHILSQWTLVIYSIHINIYNTDKHMYKDTQIVERSLFNDINGAYNLGVKTNKINRSSFKLLPTPGIIPSTNYTCIENFVLW